MTEAGVALKPGETAEYIIIDHTGKKNPVKAKPFIFHQPEDGYDIEKYTELALDAVEVLLEPLGYTYEMIEEMAGISTRKRKTRNSAVLQESFLSI
jgi:DNA polymerase elongation subunit (family B)